MSESATPNADRGVEDVKVETECRATLAQTWGVQVPTGLQGRERSAAILRAIEDHLEEGTMMLLVSETTRDEGPRSISWIHGETLPADDPDKAPRESALGRTQRVSDSDALEHIHRLMDGSEWSSDTPQDIAEVLVLAGFEFGEPDEPAGPR